MAARDGLVAESPGDRSGDPSDERRPKDFGAENGVMPAAPAQFGGSLGAASRGKVLSTIERLYHKTSALHESMSTKPSSDLDRYEDPESPLLHGLLEDLEARVEKLAQRELSKQKANGFRAPGESRLMTEHERLLQLVAKQQALLSATQMRVAALEAAPPVDAKAPAEPVETELASESAMLIPGEETRVQAGRKHVRMAVVPENP